MKYIVCQDWKNTKGNHAGMAYLSNALESRGAGFIRSIIIPDYSFSNSNQLLHKLGIIFSHIFYFLINTFIALYLVFISSKGDDVFLFEYLLKSKKQFVIAKILKFFCPKDIRVIALPHLTPIKLEKQFSSEDILKYSKPIDLFFTLGSSLSTYLVKQGISSDVVKTSFHYVDTDYYCPSNECKLAGRLNVLIMGLQMRDFSFIAELIRKSPNVDFTICRWNQNLDGIFVGLDNVIEKGVLSELELLETMQNADVSLNIMIDTVGSNVITTSIAVGLAMLVSDVGSIRDYCTDSNSIICKTKEDFITAIDRLDNNRVLLAAKKKASLYLVHKFDMSSFYNEFINF